MKLAVSILKNSNGLLIFTVFLSVIVICSPARADNNLQKPRTYNEITITTGEWPPFTGKELKNGGTACETVRKAFHQMGYKVKFMFLPWKRAQNLARQGKANGSKTPEREKDFLYSDAVLDISVVLFHMKDFNFHWKTLEDIKGLRVGTVIGFKYEQEFDKAIDDGILQAYKTPTMEQNLRKLLAGRIHISPMEKESAYYTLGKILPRELEGIIVHNPRPLNTASLHLIMCKSEPDSNNLMKIFNKGLKLSKYKDSSSGTGKANK